MEARLDELEFIFKELSTISLKTQDGRAGGARCDVPEELDISTIGCRSMGSELGTQARGGNEVEMPENKQQVLGYEQKIAEYERRIERLLCENAEFRSRVKSLRTELIEMRGAVQILCRIKPSVGHCEYGEHSIAVDGKRFTLDKVFGPESRQADVYREVGPLVEAVLEGYKVCVFAYGQTGSGKTHTMEGPCSDRGVIYRSLDSIAALARELARDGCTVEYGVRCVEVYNEEPRCLLGGQAVQPLHDGKETQMRGCKEVATGDISEVYDALHAAVMQRRIGETKCNLHSSRSHFMFMLKVRARSATELREGALVLVDLAGSERLSESKAEHERLKETQNINRSLSALGNVFTALRRRDGHVPFRDSKLTYLMQEYLTGQSKTMMIVNVNFDSVPEAICSLRFAAKVSECELGRPEKNRTRAM